jgi:hypothetical protein
MKLSRKRINLTGGRKKSQEEKKAKQINKAKKKTKKKKEKDDGFMARLKGDDTESVEARKEGINIRDMRERDKLRKNEYNKELISAPIFPYYQFINEKITGVKKSKNQVYDNTFAINLYRLFLNNDSNYWKNFFKENNKIIEFITHEELDFTADKKIMKLCYSSPDFFNNPPPKGDYRYDVHRTIKTLFKTHIEYIKTIDTYFDKQWNMYEFFFNVTEKTNEHYIDYIIFIYKIHEKITSGKNIPTIFDNFKTTLEYNDAGFMYALKRHLKTMGLVIKFYTDKSPSTYMENEDRPVSIKDIKKRLIQNVPKGAKYYKINSESGSDDTIRSIEKLTEKEEDSIKEASASASASEVNSNASTGVPGQNIKNALEGLNKKFTEELDGSEADPLKELAKDLKAAGMKMTKFSTSIIKFIGDSSANDNLSETVKVEHIKYFLTDKLGRYLREKFIYAKYNLDVIEKIITSGFNGWSLFLSAETYKNMVISFELNKSALGSSLGHEDYISNIGFTIDKNKRELKWVNNGVQNGDGGGDGDGGRDDMSMVLNNINNLQKVVRENIPVIYKTDEIEQFYNIFEETQKEDRVYAVKNFFKHGWKLENEKEFKDIFGNETKYRNTNFFRRLSKMFGVAKVHFKPEFLTMEMISFILLKDVFEKEEDINSVILGIGVLKHLFQNKEELYCYLFELYNKSSNDRTKEEEFIYDYLSKRPSEPNDKKFSAEELEIKNDNIFNISRFEYIRIYIQENHFICQSEDIVKDIDTILKEKNVAGDWKFDYKETENVLKTLMDRVMSIEDGRWNKHFAVNVITKMRGGATASSWGIGATDVHSLNEFPAPSWGINSNANTDNTTVTSPSWGINSNANTDNTTVTSPSWGIITKKFVDKVSNNDGSEKTNLDLFGCFLLRRKNYLEMKTKLELYPYEIKFKKFLNEANVIEELNKLKCGLKSRELISLKKGEAVSGVAEKYKEYILSKPFKIEYTSYYFKNLLGTILKLPFTISQFVLWGTKWCAEVANYIVAYLLYINSMGSGTRIKDDECCNTDGLIKILNKLKEISNIDGTEMTINNIAFPVYLDDTIKTLTDTKLTGKICVTKIKEIIKEIKNAINIEAQNIKAQNIEAQKNKNSEEIDIEWEKQKNKELNEQLKKQNLTGYRGVNEGFHACTKHLIDFVFDVTKSILLIKFFKGSNSFTQTTEINKFLKSGYGIELKRMETTETKKIRNSNKLRVRDSVYLTGKVMKNNKSNEHILYDYTNTNNKTNTQKHPYGGRLEIQYIKIGIWKFYANKEVIGNNNLPDTYKYIFAKEQKKNNIKKVATKLASAISIGPWIAFTTNSHSYSDEFIEAIFKEKKKIAKIDSDKESLEIKFYIPENAKDFNERIKVNKQASVTEEQARTNTMLESRKTETAAIKKLYESTVGGGLSHALKPLFATSPKEFTSDSNIFIKKLESDHFVTRDKYLFPPVFNIANSKSELNCGDISKKMKLITKVTMGRISSEKGKSRCTSDTLNESNMFTSDDKRTLMLSKKKKKEDQSYCKPYKTSKDTHFLKKWKRSRKQLLTNKGLVCISPDILKEEDYDKKFNTKVKYWGFKKNDLVERFSYNNDNNDNIEKIKFYKLKLSDVRFTGTSDEPTDELKSMGKQQKGYKYNTNEGIVKFINNYFQRILFSEVLKTTQITDILTHFMKHKRDYNKKYKEANKDFSIEGREKKLRSANEARRDSVFKVYETETGHDFKIAMAEAKIAAERAGHLKSTYSNFGQQDPQAAIAAGIEAEKAKMASEKKIADLQAEITESNKAQAKEQAEKVKLGRTKVFTEAAAKAANKLAEKAAEVVAAEHNKELAKLQAQHAEQVRKANEQLNKLEADNFRVNQASIAAANAATNANRQNQQELEGFQTTISGLKVTLSLSKAEKAAAAAELSEVIAAAAAAAVVQNEVAAAAASTHTQTQQRFSEQIAENQQQIVIINQKNVTHVQTIATLKAAVAAADAAKAAATATAAKAEVATANKAATAVAAEAAAAAANEAAAAAAAKLSKAQSTFNSSFDQANELIAEKETLLKISNESNAKYISELDKKTTDNKELTAQITHLTSLLTSTSFDKEGLNSSIEELRKQLATQINEAATEKAAAAKAAAKAAATKAADKRAIDEANARIDELTQELSKKQQDAAAAATAAATAAAALAVAGANAEALALASANLQEAKATEKLLNKEIDNLNSQLDKLKKKNKPKTNMPPFRQSTPKYPVAHNLMSLDRNKIGSEVVAQRLATKRPDPNMGSKPDLVPDPVPDPNMAAGNLVTLSRSNHNSIRNYSINPAQLYPKTTEMHNTGP